MAKAPAIGSIAYNAPLVKYAVTSPWYESTAVKMIAEPIPKSSVFPIGFFFDLL